MLAYIICSYSSTPVGLGTTRDEIHDHRECYGLWACDCMKNVTIATRIIDATLLLTSTMVSASDVRRLFLQSLLSRGIVSEAPCKTLYAKCVEAVKGTRCHTRRLSWLTIFLKPRTMIWTLPVPTPMRLLTKFLNNSTRLWTIWTWKSKAHKTN